MPKDKEKLSKRGHWKPQRKKCEKLVFFFLCLDTRTEGPSIQGISVLELIVICKKYLHFKETEAKQKRLFLKKEGKKKKKNESNFQIPNFGTIGTTSTEQTYE